MGCGPWLSGSGDELGNHTDEGWFQGQTHMSIAPENMSNQNANHWFAMKSAAIRCSDVGRTASYSPGDTAVTEQVVSTGSFMGLE